MKLILLASALLLLPAAAATYESTVSFAPPMQAEGEGEATGDLQILLETNQQINLERQPIQWELYSTRQVVMDDILDTRWGTEPEQIDAGQATGQIQATSTQWSTVHARATRCETQLEGDLQLHGVTQTNAAQILGGDAASFPAVRSWDWGDGAAFETTGDIHVDCATGTIEFYGFDVRFGDRVIETGAIRTTNANEADVIEYRHLVVHVEQLRTQINDAAGFLTIVNPELQWIGDVVLPLASGDITGELGTTERDGSWRFHGPMAIQGFTSDGDRLHATVQSEQPAVVDSRPVFLESKAVPVATVGLLATAAGLLAKYAFASALFTRLPPDEALEHPRRRALKDYIDAHPGATFRELIRATGIPAGTCRHHLSVLQRCQLIVEHRHRQTVRFFENHGKFDQTWEQVVMLREPELARLHALIEQHPKMMQKDILDTAVREWGWSRSTTQHRLERLARNDVVLVEQFGRRKLYSAAKPETRRGAYGLPT